MYLHHRPGRAPPACHPRTSCGVRRGLSLAKTLRLSRENGTLADARHVFVLSRRLVRPLFVCYCQAALPDDDDGHHRHRLLLLHNTVRPFLTVLFFVILEPSIGVCSVAAVFLRGAPRWDRKRKKQLGSWDAGLQRLQCWQTFFESATFPIYAFSSRLSVLLATRLATCYLVILIDVPCVFICSVIF